MFSQTVEYALRAMMCLASLGGPAVNNDTVAGKTNVPPGYLSKIMRDLVVADLVRSFRGPHGGFSLARDPSAITILDVVNAVDPFQRIRRCPAGDPFHGELCALHQRLDNLLAEIERTLRRTTLAEVLGGAGACAGMANPQPSNEPRP